MLKRFGGKSLPYTIAYMSESSTAAPRLVPKESATLPCMATKWTTAVACMTK